MNPCAYSGLCEANSKELEQFRTKIAEIEISLKQAKQLMDADSAKIKALEDINTYLSTPAMTSNRQAWEVCKDLGHHIR